MISMVTQTEFLSMIQSGDLNEPTVFIMRGLPGSGKSTLAKRIKTETSNRFTVKICSADDYWIQPDGTYMFDPNKAPQNHYKCLRVFNAHVMDYVRCVIVDNTSCATREFDHYIKIANAYGYKVILVTLKTDVDTSIRRNIHSVPEKTVRHMASKMERSDSYIVNLQKDLHFEHFVIDSESA
jgi:2',3'-cyclic-nucleotide 3'-phosphodiesterase